MARSTSKRLLDKLERPGLCSVIKILSKTMLVRDPMNGAPGILGLGIFRGPLQTAPQNVIRGEEFQGSVFLHDLG